MNVFEILREQIALDRVLSTNGSAKIRCVAPDHRDNDSSMHVYQHHVHCFACGFHGDVVDLWAAMHGFDRPVEAALDLAQVFGVSLPELSEEGRQSVAERREAEARHQSVAKASHRALEHHGGVREWWVSRGFGPELRNRFLLGANKDGTEAVIPFWSRGRVLLLIRCKLEGEPKYNLPKVEQFPEGRKPLFVPGRIKREIFLVKGYLDALAVGSTGRSVVAVGGTKMSVPQRDELQRITSPVSMIYILPDTNESGAEAARTWGRKFFPQARICTAHYGEGASDIVDTFAREGAERTGEHLDRLMGTSKDMIDLETEVAANLEGGVRQKLVYATENIVPLLAKVGDETIRDATADIVVDRVKGLKKKWLNKGIKEEQGRLMTDWSEEVLRLRQEEMERHQEEYRARILEVQPEIDALFGPGVLGRLRDTAAAMHHVYGDREPLELALLVALGAQLEPLPNGRPLGASILLTAPPSRGKNHIIDAAVRPMPSEFYFSFEIASGQSLYYRADEDPDFLRHTFAYPNEIEGAEQLWEFLRPMLSKGKAHKIVTAKDPEGNIVSREITVEGPVTIAIPTIRNKTDDQLQTRLLLAELPDYPGRVKEHSVAISEQLLPDAAKVDYSREEFLWQEGLRQLTSVRRVVFPLRHPDFALDDDQVSHGARLWANLLSLMATHAWLEQRNRRLLDLGEEMGEGRVAVEATPDDYAVAYRIFTKVCRRTVVNLSATHRKILGALYDLHQEFVGVEGFPQRQIADSAGISQSMISDNKTFLVTSAKLMKETDAGLALVEGADPSWWAEGDLVTGLPIPEKVRSWWEDRDPPPEGGDHADHPDHPYRESHNPHTYTESVDRKDADQSPIADRSGPESSEAADHDRQLIDDELISEKGIDKLKTGDQEDVIGLIGGSEGGDDACLHGVPLGYPCDECDIEKRFG